MESAANIQQAPSLADNLNVLSPDAMRMRNVRANESEDEKRDRQAKDRARKREIAALKNFDTNFLKDGDDFRVFTGNISQNAERFDGAPACFGHSLAAASFKDPIEWKSKDFETVLAAGHRMYRKMFFLKKSHHSYLERFDAEHLGGVVSVGNMKKSIEIEAVPFAGPLKLADDLRQDYFQPLDVAITRTFELCRRALFLSNKLWLCLAKSDYCDGYFLINSHGVGPKNEWKPHHPARIFWCSTVEKLVETIGNGLGRNFGSYYQLFGMFVEPVEDDCDVTKSSSTGSKRLHGTDTSGSDSDEPENKKSRNEKAITQEDLQAALNAIKKPEN